MNSKNGGKQHGFISSAKECAYIAVFVALVIAAQAMLSSLPNVEVVSVLFISYAFVFGWKRGMLSATVFALLRQFLFGFYPTVLILYLTYFNILALLFGLIGQFTKKKICVFPLIVLLATVCAVGFTLFDNMLTPLWYGYSQRATQLYIKASLPFMASHVFSVAISVGILFLPLSRAFEVISFLLNIKKK